MKKVILVALLVLFGIIPVSAQTMDELFNVVKNSIDFSAMTLPKEQCKQNKFDAMDIALSETVADTTIATIKAELAKLPATQKTVEVEEDGTFVSIYNKPLAGGKTQVLIVVFNGKHGVIVKGICDQKHLDENLKDFHLNNLFGN